MGRTYVVEDKNMGLGPRSVSLTGLEEKADTDSIDLKNANDLSDIRVWSPEDLQSLRQSP